MTTRRRPPRDSTTAFAAAAAGAAPKDTHAFRLYVAGTSERSTRAIQNARALMDTHFAGRCALEVIDIFQQPGRARVDQVLAVPTLVRHTPLPIKRFIGDLSNGAALLAGLGIVVE